MRATISKPLLFFSLLICSFSGFSQQPSTKKEKERKNIIRYDLSGGLLFGVSKYLVFGYERVVSPHQSFSINFGPIAFPKFVSITTDSFNLQSDKKNTGINFSVDYRFYLAKENKYNAPHGLYIGPYYSYNHFHRENNWTFRQSGSTEKLVSTDINFNINTIGGELGYQFVLWKRFAIDMVLIGPGFSYYDFNAGIAGDLSEDERTQLREALKQLVTQKFPGLNYVLSDKQVTGHGTLGTWSVGYRYLIHIGFVF